MGFSLTTHDGYTAAPYAELFDLDAYGAYDAVEEGNSYAGALMQRAIDAFSEARTAHGFLEKLYMPAMDFERLEESGQALINSIF